MLESKIQRKITDFLEKQGFLVNKIMITTLNGWPDLIAHRDGVTVYVETKREGRDLDPVQAYRHKQLTDKGIPCFKAESVEEVIVAIKKFNIQISEQ